jgi:LPXTG-site transpeptidase (sortase) family protein
VLLAVAVAPSLTGCGHRAAAPDRTLTHPLPGASASATPSAARPTAPPTPDISEIGMPGSRPLRIDIPRIGVHARLTALGLADNGAVDTPPFSEPHTAGWYRGSVTPGQTGTSVIVGHVDTHRGPAVFYLLSLVKHGDSIQVHRADSSTAVFTVDTIKVIPDSSFDAQQVYADTPRAELRLITCGGTFDRATQEYSSNVVVYAHLTGAQETTGSKIE